MKRFAIALTFFALTTMSAFAQGRVTVKVLERTDLDTGATLKLQLSNGDEAVITCTGKFVYRGRNSYDRPCRVPLVDVLDVEFKGDKAKLFWLVSLDGKKIASETYKIVGVVKTQEKP
jgi:hypothetical protein